MPDLTIATVLRSGGLYGPEWVQALHRQVAQHAPDAAFVCLSDVTVPGVRVVPLAHGWPGWWSKLELFRPGALTGRVLYLDLDTDIVGPLDWLDYTGPLALIDDFYRPRLAQSGIMAFTPGAETERLWTLWSQNAGRYMRKFRGDGEWLHVHAPDAPRLQSMYPGRIVSHKVHCAETVPERARLVAFHGSPKRYPDGVIRRAA